MIRGILAVLVVCVPAAAVAQVRQLRDLNGRVDAGSQIEVYDDLGRSQKFRFEEIDKTGDLIVRERFGRERLVVTSDRISRIEELRNDPIGKGLGIGLGAGMGLTLIAMVGCNELEYDVGDCFLGGLLIYALPGAAIGALIDYGVKERFTIYEAPGSGGRGASLTVQPLPARRGGGAQFALEF